MSSRQKQQRDDYSWFIHVLCCSGEAEEKEREAKCLLKSNGYTWWLVHRIHRSACLFDITNYPFDEHTCHMWFQSLEVSLRQEMINETPFGVQLQASVCWFHFTWKIFVLSRKQTLLSIPISNNAQACSHWLTEGDFHTRTQELVLSAILVVLVNKQLKVLVFHFGWTLHRHVFVSGALTRSGHSAVWEVTHGFEHVSVRFPTIGRVGNSQERFISSENAERLGRNACLFTQNSAQVSDFYWSLPKDICSADSKICFLSQRNCSSSWHVFTADRIVLWQETENLSEHWWHCSPSGFPWRWGGESASEPTCSSCRASSWARWAFSSLFCPLRDQTDIPWVEGLYHWVSCKFVRI